MRLTTIRGLADRASAIIREVQAERRPVLVTNRGVPVAVILPIDNDRLSQAIEDWVLATAPDMLRATVEADAALGTCATVPLSDV